jgi:hypothetical protein
MAAVVLVVASIANCSLAAILWIVPRHRARYVALMRRIVPAEVSLQIEERMRAKTDKSIRMTAVFCGLCATSTLVVAVLLSILDA